MKKKIMAVVLCTSMLFPTVCVNAETSESDIKSAIEKAIEWKADKDSPFYGIGSYSSDFYIMALNRMGKNYDYSRYLAGLDGVAAGYGEEHNKQKTDVETHQFFCYFIKLVFHNISSLINRLYRKRPLQFAQE